MVGSCFTKNLRLRVGNGASVLFWSDMWVRDAPLCDRFSRLYDLSENLSQPP